MMRRNSASMRCTSTRWAVLTCALFASTACGGEVPDRAEGTAAATRDLLRSAPPAPDTVRPVVDISSLGFNHGDSLAPVRILEMSDFGCGFCRKFHLETWPVLRDEFVASGKVQWKFLPTVSGMFANSGDATSSAECALEQGGSAFETVQERLWTEQATWKGASDATGVLRGWATEAGLDMDRYDGCIADGRPTQRIEAGTQLSRQLGVRGTPTFFILGYPPVQGALPTEQFRELLSLIYQDRTGS